MIAVIADDFTGAAELGGIGLRYGLTVEINTKVNLQSAADLVVIAADTRSKNKQEAVKEMADITAKVVQLTPQLIFKKIDSVLRGHVLDELNAQMKVLNVERALLVSANPALQRTLTKGTYFVKDKPIHTTGFSQDPEFPITTSNVLEMLRIGERDVHVKNKAEGLHQTGITVGEVLTDDDLKAWATLLSNIILAVGSSGFFTAILDLLFSKPKDSIQVNKVELEHPALYVCGTTFNKSREAIVNIKNNGGPVSYMPLPVISSPDPSETMYKEWADEVVDLLLKNKKAIIAIDPGLIPGNETALSLRNKTAGVVGKIFDQIHISELLIEGGSTAAAIIIRLNFTMLIPLQEVAPGVIRMRVKEIENVFITLKPGSYDWSEQLWNF